MKICYQRSNHVKAKYMTMVILVIMLLLSSAACGGTDSTGNDPLENTSWMLMAYRKTRPIDGTIITATFKDGQIRGSAGCNSYGGTYQVSGDKIRVGEIALTMMACMEPQGVMEQENVFMGFLSESQTYRLSDGRLVIFGLDGEALTFVPQE
jgi:heat shock protein HslJ